MDIEDFRKYGKEMIDYICQYMTNVEEFDVLPKVQPGYLKDLLPDKAPMDGENFENVIDDLKTKIMPGIVHWSHPNFFGYSPAGNSYPSILGDMLSSAIGSIGFSWASCPASTELEIIVLDWYAKALGLPQAFLSETSGSHGGGALQGSASECTFICMLTARARAIKMLKGDITNVHDSIFVPQLIAYASKEAHSSVEKAAKMALVKLRIIEADERGRMRVDLLKQTIQNDINAGLTPFFVVATVGTTGACAFDNLTEIGKVCEEVPSIWFHVDGAYAGNSFILPEMRIFSEGLEYADSFNTNPNKLLLTNFDASAMWVRDVESLKATFNVDPLYLQHSHENAVDFRHYGIPLSRRFRALKLWFVFRTYGIEGLQAHVRNHIKLSRKFEQLVRKSEHLEVCNDVQLGVVCFCMKDGKKVTKELLSRLNYNKKISVVPSVVSGKYCIRFCVTYEHAQDRHIVDAWTHIKCEAAAILNRQSAVVQTKIAQYPFSVKPELYILVSMFLCATQQALSTK